MSYQNLKAELRRRGVSYSDVAELLNMSVNNFSLKINERIPLTVEEIKKVRDTFCSYAKLDYLLVSDGDVAPKRKQNRHPAGLSNA